MTSSEDMPPHRRKLVCVQVLRAFAAVSVVAFHLQPFESRFLLGAPVAPHFFALGETGVDAFFVVSGFIIRKTTDSSMRAPAGVFSFIGNRFFRIFPLYWVYCAAVILASQAVPSLFFHRHDDIDYVASFLLTPSHHPTVLLVSWTLTFELQFYLLFAAASAVSTGRVLAWAGCLWAGLIILKHVWITRSSGLFAIPLDDLNLEFLMGCAIASTYRHRSWCFGALTLAIGSSILGLGFVMLRPDDTIPDGWLRVLFGGGGFSFVLIGLLALEASIRRITPKFVVAIGDSSYSLYLSHLLTIGVVGYAWRLLAPSAGAPMQVAALFSAIAASVLVGWVSYRCIERPLLRLLQGLSLDRLRAFPAARAKDISRRTHDEDVTGPVDHLVRATAVLGHGHRDAAS